MASQTMIVVCNEKTEYQCQSGLGFWYLAFDSSGDHSSGIGYGTYQSRLQSTIGQILSRKNRDFLSNFSKGECIQRNTICDAEMNCLRAVFNRPIWSYTSWGLRLWFNKVQFKTIYLQTNKVGTTNHQMFVIRRYQVCCSLHF